MYSFFLADEIVFAEEDGNVLVAKLKISPLANFPCAVHPLLKSRFVPLTILFLFVVVVVLFFLPHAAGGCH